MQTSKSTFFGLMAVAAGLLLTSSAFALDIQGTVRDALTSRTVAGARVYAIVTDGWGRRYAVATAYTDAVGCYRVRVSTVGSYSMQARSGTKYGIVNNVAYIPPRIGVGGGAGGGGPILPTWPVTADIRIR